MSLFPLLPARTLAVLSASALIFTLAARAQSSVPAPVAEAGKTKAVELDTYVVSGETFRPINVDQPRSVDGPRPYVIIDRAAIERSGATSFADIARQMSFDTESRPETAAPGQENRQKASINFRGVGQNSTLILINGRRTAPGYGGQYGQVQFDLNSMPLAAIERIEIMPYSASAVYGGSAIGGVINVVLRNDYRGSEVSVKYGNTTSGDAAHSAVNFASGYSTRDGRTNLSISGGWQKDNAMQDRDRGYLRELRARTLALTPATILNSTTPPNGYPGNVRATTPLLGTGALFAAIPVGLNRPATLADFTGTVGTYNIADYAKIGDAIYVRPEKELLSFQVMANRKLFANLNVFAELNFNQNEAYSQADSALTLSVPANNPFNPFGRAVSVTNFFDDVGGYGLYSKTKTQRWVVGANGELPGGWKYMADVIYEARHDAAVYANRSLGLQQDTYSATGLSPLKETDPNRAYNPFADFSTGYRNRQEILDRVLTDDIRNKHYDMLSGALRLNGPVKEFSWGKLNLSTGLEYRDEETTKITTVYRFPASGQIALSSAQPPSGRSVAAGYAEFNLPITLGRGDEKSPVPLFDVSAAIRYEDYSDFGAATNEQVALKFAPVESVQFRVSYATGYTPPDLSSLVFPLFVSQTLVTDANRANESVTVTQRSGGNPDLVAEESVSYTGGVIFMPKALRRLRLSLDWFQIKKDNQIIDTPTLASLFENEDFLPAGRLVRAAPTPADVAAGRRGVLIEVDRRAMNFTKLSTQGVDFAAEYGFGVLQGDLTVRAQGTYVESFERQTTPTSPAAEFAGNPLGSTAAPLRFRANASATYTRSQYALTVAARYLPHYRAAAGTDVVQGGTHVKQSTEFDVNYSWQFGRATRPGFCGSLLANTRVTLGANNVFNELPPYVGSGQGYSLFNDARGRFVYVSLRRHF